MACDVCTPLIIQAVKMTDDFISDRCSACGEKWDNAGRPRWDEVGSQKMAAKIPGTQIPGFLDSPEQVRKLHQSLIDKTEVSFQKLSEASRNSFFDGRKKILD